MDCTLVGPETACFCTHRFKQHQTDFKQLPSTRPILLPCKEPGCGKYNNYKWNKFQRYNWLFKLKACSSFHYLPKNGTQPIRCGCKHTNEDHKLAKPFNCLKSRLFFNIY